MLTLTQEPTMNAPREKLVTDIQVLMSDVEELARATASQIGILIGRR